MRRSARLCRGPVTAVQKLSFGHEIESGAFARLRGAPSRSEVLPTCRCRSSRVPTVSRATQNAIPPQSTCGEVLSRVDRDRVGPDALVPGLNRAVKADDDAEGCRGARQLRRFGERPHLRRPSCCRSKAGSDPNWPIAMHHQRETHDTADAASNRGPSPASAFQLVPSNSIGVLPGRGTATQNVEETQDRYTDWG